MRKMEELVKRLENVPLVYTSEEASKLSWKRYNYIPLVVEEVKEKIEEVIGSNFVLITPMMTVANVEYRSWHSKTYCRHNDCLAEQRLYEELAEILKILPKQPLHTRIVPEWRHYCGAEPIYHRYYVFIIQVPNLTYTLVLYSGGQAWYAEYENICGVYVKGISEFRTDGCVEWQHFINPPKPQP